VTYNFEKNEVVDVWSFGMACKGLQIGNIKDLPQVSNQKNGERILEKSSHLQKNGVLERLKHLD
jgi:hypothetical protein